MSQPKQWFCEVCGYLHTGEAPPEECPVCGVGPDQFSLVELEEIADPRGPDARGAGTWHCTGCNYLAIAGEAPKSCPACGGGRELFVPFESD